MRGSENPLRFLQLRVVFLLDAGESDSLRPVSTSCELLQVWLSFWERFWLVLPEDLPFTSVPDAISFSTFSVNTDGFGSARVAAAFPASNEPPSRAAGPPS